MRPISIPLSLAFCHVAQAHYFWGRLIVNDTITPTWQYVRHIDRLDSSDIALVDPLYDFLSTDLRCGRNASAYGSQTQTATVVAGSEVGFQIGASEVYYDVFHAGPGSAWLSKAPGDLESYTGDGDWFKIASAAAKPGKDWSDPSRNYTSPSDWVLYHATSWNFTIPATTPPGKYLLRVEHINPSRNSQFYANCAQIIITGGGGGVPAPLVKIPGVYSANQSDVFFTPIGSAFNISYYTAPAPAVWTG